MSHATTSSDAVASTFRAFNAAIFEDHDLDAVEEYLSPDVIQYQSGIETARGHDGACEYFESVLSAFPDIDLEIVELVADEERAMIRFEATGTHEGDLPIVGPDGETDVVEPTHTTVSWEGFVSARFDDGRIAEVNLVSDRFGMAQQLGLLPTGA